MEGTWEEMKAGCNTFQAGNRAEPGLVRLIYLFEDLPQVGLNAALTGTPE